jgi:hypothetical protein
VWGALSDEADQIVDTACYTSFIVVFVGCHGNAIKKPLLHNGRVCQLSLRYQQNVLVTRTQVKTLYKEQISNIQSNTQTNLDLRNTTSEYGFHIQHRNSGMFPVEDLAHDSGRTLVRAEYGYQKGSPNTNS